MEERRRGGSRKNNREMKWNELRREIESKRGGKEIVIDLVRLDSIRLDGGGVDGG